MRTKAPVIFDESAKIIQKTRASAHPDAADYDYVRDEFAARLVQRLPDIRRNFTRALDLGCGSGHIARMLAVESIPADILDKGNIEAFDNYSGCAGTTVGDLYTKIPKDDSSVDLVLSSNWLHWINDLGAVLREVNRVLTPDGCFLGCMPCMGTLIELRIALQMAEDEVKGGLSGRISPFVKANEMGSILERCGFKFTTIDTERAVIRYKDIHALMKHLRGMGESNAISRRNIHAGRKLFERAGEIYAEKFTHEMGGVTATFDNVYFIGWKKDQGQTKPLERGTGGVSLADLVKGSGSSDTKSGNGKKKAS